MELDNIFIRNLEVPFAPSNFFTGRVMHRQTLHQSLLAPKQRLHQKFFCTPHPRRLHSHQTFTPETSIQDKWFTRSNFYTRKPIAPESFYRKQLFHTKAPLHQAPFYIRRLWHQKPSTPKPFIQEKPLNQTGFPGQTFNARNNLRQVQIFLRKHSQYRLS